MKNLSAIILFGLLCLPCLMHAERPVTETPERQHAPAEVRLQLPDLPQEIREENDLLVNFAMSGVFPDDAESYSEEELAALIDKKAADLEDILSRYPDSSAALDAYSTLLDHPHFHERLLATLEEIHEKGACSAEFWSTYLAVLNVCERNDELFKFLPEALNANPDSETLLLQALEFYAREGNAQEIDPLLERALQNDLLKDQPIVQLAQLRRLLETKQEDAAKALTQKIVENEFLMADPENNLNFIWQCLYPIDAFQEIAHIFSAILVHSIGGLDKALVQKAFYYDILVICESGTYDIATEMLDNFIARVAAGELHSSVLLDLGNILHNFTTEIEKESNGIPQKLLQLNIQIARAIHKTLPVIYKDDNTDRTLSRYLLQDGDYQEALKLLQHIQKPDSTDLFLLATTLSELERPQEALVIMKKLAAAEAENLKAPFYLLLGDLESKCGNQQESDDALKKALELDPNFDNAANYLGYSYAERGILLEEAEQLLKLALSKKPENSAYLDSMAWLKFKQGDYPEALRWMAKALHELDSALDYEGFEAMQEELTGHLREILRALHCDYLADCY